MNFPDVAVSGETYDFFPMPAMEFDGITTSADLIGMFNDTPRQTSLMRYLVTAEAQASGRRAAVPSPPTPRSRWMSYPDEVQGTAEALIDAETVRYDASDKMPAEMEAAFRAGILDIQNPATWTAS